MAAASASAARGRFGCRFLGCCWFRLTLIIGFIEPGSFKDHSGPRTDQALKFGLAAFRAFGEFGFGHGLKGFEPMSAGSTFVFVSWHDGVLREFLFPSAPDPAYQSIFVWDKGDCGTGFYLNTFLNLSFIDCVASVSSPLNRANSSKSCFCCAVSFVGTSTMTRA